MTFHDRIRSRAARLFSAQVMERVIDPVLTDIEIESRSAIAEGRTWRSRWVRIAGCVALLRVVALCAFDRTAHDWGAEDRWALTRTIGIAAVAFAVTALLLIAVAARALPTEAHLLLYLIPQALPIAIPVGVTWGILCGLGGRVAAFRLKGAALALALACSAASLATTVWLLPVANQAFRVAVFEQLRPPGNTATLPPGAAEMPMGELRETIDALTRSGEVRSARDMAFVYYVRWSLPCAPFVLALFALALTSRLSSRGWVLAVAAFGACFAYTYALDATAAAARQTELPVIALVWLPNLMFALASTAVMAASMRSDLPSKS